jgi:hypothetical protein
MERVDMKLLHCIRISSIQTPTANFNVTPFASMKPATALSHTWMGKSQVTISVTYYYLTFAITLLNRVRYEADIILPVTPSHSLNRNAELATP